MNCPACRQVLSERGFFCKFCGAQARCRNCREVLEPEAIACVECGAKVGESPVIDPPHLLSSSAPALHRNTLSYHEDRNSRHFDASLTDTAIQGLGGVLGDVFTHRNATRPPTPPRILTPDNGADGQIQLPLPPSGPDTMPETQKTDDAATNDSPDKDRIMRLFQADGTKLELKDNRLKAGTGADFLRRVTYLFLYAHECYARPATPKADVITMLDAAKILDKSGNARRWLAKKKGFHQDKDDNLKLTQPGREDAMKYLNEALNSAVPDQWNPDTKTPRKRKTKG